MKNLKGDSKLKFSRVALLQTFAGPFQARGGDIQELLARHQLPDDLLDDPTELIETSVLYIALEDMAAVLEDPYFCALVAFAAAEKGTPMLASSAKNARTLGDFLCRIIQEVAQQFDNVEYLLNVSREISVFRINRTRTSKRPTPQVDAVGTTFYVRVFQLGLSERFDAKSIIVSACTLDAVPMELFPNVTFAISSQNALSISFPTSWLVFPFELKWCEAERINYHLNESSDKEYSLRFLRNTIQKNISNPKFNITLLAMASGTNVRQLQRTFAHEGTSFRQIVDDVRRIVALELLSGTKYPMKKIALEIGINSESSLSRSVKRWCGESPIEYRRRVSEKS